MMMEVIVVVVVVATLIGAVRMRRSSATEAPKRWFRVKLADGRARDIEAQDAKEAATEVFFGSGVRKVASLEVRDIADGDTLRGPEEFQFNYSCHCHIEEPEAE